MKHTSNLASTIQDSAFRSWIAALVRTRKETLLAALLSTLSLSQPAAVMGANVFRLPTANRALFEPNGGEKFFVGTVGRPWTSGTFGCVRSDGWQLHEGLDIRCLLRDRHGEPVDPVLATADGTVAYISPRPELSNYGKYLILRHVIEGVEIYSLYAHLKEIRSDLRVGAAVRAGDTIAVMGRTSNTRQRISKDRAHVHFELNLLNNDRFPSWFGKTFPGQRNDHAQWNGQNLLGIDPRGVFLSQAGPGSRFSLVHFLRSQTELCRVLVRDTDFPWLKRYGPLKVRNPIAEKEGIAGYELSLNFTGLPFRVVPRAASEIKGKSRFQLLAVNEAEQKRCPCRKLVIQRRGRWELGANGVRLLELLTF